VHPDQADAPGQGVAAAAGDAAREWLACVACGATYDVDDVRYACACGGLLSTHQLAVQGSPRKVIPRFARRMKIALIVWVAAGGFTELRRRHVLDRTPCAALVVRPR